MGEQHAGSDVQQPVPAPARPRPAGAPLPNSSSVAAVRSTQSACERVAGIAVSDARTAEDTPQPAHDHGQLRGRIPRLVVEPEHVGQPLEAHRTALGDAEHAERHTGLATPELMLRETLDGEATDDVDAQRVRLSFRARRRRGLSADHDTKNTWRGSARGKQLPARDHALP